MKNWKKIAVSILVALAVILIIFSVKGEKVNEPAYLEKYGFQPDVVVDGDWMATNTNWYELDDGLSDWIMVKGNADLRNSPFFAIIPENLWVEGDLYVHPLTEEIPETIHVGGDVIFEDEESNPSISKSSLRHLDIGGIGYLRMSKRLEEMLNRDYGDNCCRDCCQHRRCEAGAR